MTRAVRLAGRWRLAAFAALCLPGCAGGGDGPDTYPVTGVVTLGGKPVAGALVQFLPAGEPAASGVGGGQAETDAEGQFDAHVVLKMGQDSKPGLPVGEYRVTVTKMEQAPGAASLANPPRNVLPVKYASPQSTTLKATVTADGEQVVEIKL